MFRRLFKWFKSLFRGEQYMKKSVDESIKKIAIVVGHTAKSPGASTYQGESEYSFNTFVASAIESYMKVNSDKKVKVFFRDGTNRSGVAKEVGAWGADLSLELHLNAFKKKAYGCEILIEERSKNFDKLALLADEITDMLAKEFNLRERHSVKDSNGRYRDGVKALNQGARGLSNLSTMRLEGVKFPLLIEPCFVNIKTKESEAIVEHKLEYAESIARYLTNL